MNWRVARAPSGRISACSMSRPTWISCSIVNRFCGLMRRSSKSRFRSKGFKRRLRCCCSEQRGVSRPLTWQRRHRTSSRRRRSGSNADAWGRRGQRSSMRAVAVRAFGPVVPTFGSHHDAPKPFRPNGATVARRNATAPVMLCGGDVSSSRRVLIVDDDAVTVDTYRRMLQLEGFTVYSASNAAEGLDTADRVQPDAIVLDLRMPVVDGLGFLRELRSAARTVGTPVAIVTGDYFIDDSIAGALQALGATIKFKPLWLEDLITLTR